MLKNTLKHRQLKILAIIIFTSFMTSTCILSKTEAAANPSQPPWKSWNVAGEQRLAVVFTEFSDVKHSVDSQTIEGRLENITKYFEDISFGKININATFVGDHWERLNNTMAYYGNGSYNQDNNGGQFITDSLRVWANYVNFSSYDIVLVVHSGEDQSSNTNQSELLWRHSFSEFGRDMKVNVVENGTKYSFWGLSYDSEFEQWGLVAHELGHDLGLPDLYIENETRFMDTLSLMASGDRNGFPHGTLPASLEGFSMFMLGWITPQEITVNSTKDLLIMTSLEHISPTLLCINLTESTYYLLEIREKIDYDEDTVSSTSLVVWLIDEDIPSLKGPAIVCSNGILSEGQTFSDAPNGVFIQFISFNSTTHKADVGLSSNMLIVDADFPNSTQLHTPINGTLRLYDTNNNPAQYFGFNISIDNKVFGLSTDDKGEVMVDLGELDLGIHTIRVLSSQFIAGELETSVDVVSPEVDIPWDIILVVIFVILLILILLLYSSRNR
jgi:M6 family metalloprotease-like protein